MARNAENVMQATRDAHGPFWFHPLLFAVFPALSYLAANIDQVPLVQGLRLTLASLMLGLIVYAAFGLTLRHRGRAAPAASLVILALLTYGRLYDGLKAAGLSGETVVRHRYLIPACALLAGIGVVWLARRLETGGLNRVLNLVSVMAVAFPLASIGIYQANVLTGAGPKDATCTLQVPEGESLPDVYIVIMDAYERDDVLREFGGYDNSPFLQSLENMGFHVAHGSLSNYRHTELSLSSLLNMEYIQDYPERFGTRPNQQWDIIQLINHSRVRQELACLGYVTVAFETGHFWTEWDDADYYIQRDASMLSGVVGGRVSRLEYLFLETTVARSILDGWTMVKAGSPPEELDPLVDHRERILFALDELAEVPALPSPKFVFVHILSPHPPFVLGAEGEPVSEADFETEWTGPARDSPVPRAYENQVTFLNKRLLEDLRVILDASDPTPIVVLMGDHGWADRDMEDKLSILNAYLVPPEAAAQLGQTITPVNTFRAIFDAAFGGTYGRLPDVSYYSLESDEYNFTVVPNTWSPDSP